MTISTLAILPKLTWKQQLDAVVRRIERTTAERLLARYYMRVIMADFRALETAPFHVKHSA